jgi:hypothetical protein
MKKYRIVATAIVEFVHYIDAESKEKAESYGYDLLSDVGMGGNTVNQDVTVELYAPLIIGN